jgi:predicted MFS family arabinose efflux permease
VLYGGAGAVFFTFAVDLVHSEGLSPAWSSLLWLMVGLGGLSGVITGAMVNRFGIGRSLTAATALLAASIVVLAAWPSIAGLAALAALAFGSAYMPFAALLAIWNQRLHPQQPTSGLVLTLGCLGAGSVIGPACLAALADAIGLRAAYILAAVLLVAGGLPLCRRAK